MQFQTTAFEMNLAGLISDREFAVLEAITESMTAGSIALDLLSIITMENLQDADIVDCIIARKFGTALMIMD